METGGSYKSRPPAEETPALLAVPPRINAAMMFTRVGKNARLVGKVISAQNNTLELEATDNGRVTIKLTSGSQASVGKYVEILGRVEANAYMTEYSLVEVGPFDVQVFDKMVTLQGNFPDIFSLEN